MTQHGEARDSASDRPNPSHTLTRRRFIGKSGGAALAVGGLGSFIAACGGGGGGSSKGSDEVVVLTWGDPAFDKKLAAEFKRETGLKLVNIPGENSADFFNKVSVGGSKQYDVVISNVGFIPKYVKQGLIEPLNLADFPASKEIYSGFLTDPRWKQWYLVEPGKKLWAMPHQWGLYTMTYRSDVVHPSDDPPSWEEMWRAPKGKAQSNNAPNNLLAIAGKLNGLSWDQAVQMSGQDLDNAVKRMRALKPFQLPTSSDIAAKNFWTKQSLVGHTFGLSFADLVNAKAKKDVATSVVPKEGTLGALDGAMLLKGAKNRDNAIKYINFEASSKSQNLYWTAYQSPTANQVTTEAVLSRGDKDSDLMQSMGGDKAELAAAMIQQQDPPDVAAWTHAWDQVLA
jgi:spermidine/putrescine transport system substrate-binding protein